MNNFKEYWNFQPNWEFLIEKKLFEEWIADFLNTNNIHTEEDFIEKIKDKRVHKIVLQSIRLKYWIPTNIPVGNICSKAYLHRYFYDKVLNQYSSHSRWIRNIVVKDINGQLLANTTMKKARAIVKRKGWDWSLFEKEMILKHPISNPEFKMKIFDATYQRQKHKCNRCKNHLNQIDWQLHHRYIPQMVYVINELWNVEILCDQCHKYKHNNWSIAQTLIKIKEIFLKISISYKN